MIRSHLLFVKHLFYAAFALAMLCCLAELGLRVYDSMTGQVTRRELYDRGMICKSWFVHHALKPSQTFTIRNPDTDARVKLALNSFGVRGSEPAIPKPPGVYRILCLGDEATLAPQIPEAETFCSQLCELLQAQTRLKVEVLNAGVPDYCPLLSYLQWKHHLAGLRPDLVILNFDMSDIADDYQCRRHTAMDAAGAPLVCAHPGLEAPRLPARTTFEDFLLLPQWGRQQIGALWAKHLLAEKPRGIDAPQGRYIWLEDHPPDWSVYIGQALAPIARTSELARGDYAGLVVATFPVPWQVSAAASDGGEVRSRAGVAPGAVYQSRRPFEILEEFCRSNKISLCDTSAEFRRAEKPEQLYLKKAALFSREGHTLYARELARFLIQNTPGFGGSSAAPAENTYPQEARVPPR